MRKLISKLLVCLQVGAMVVLATAVQTTAQDTLRVVTVNYPLQYMAQRLLGDTAEVVFPVPPGTDPSFWRPSVSDISMIQEADLIVLNGAGFATWIDRVSLPRARIVNTSNGLTDAFIVTESITHSHGDGGEHSHEGLAAYTWLDPQLAIAQAEAIAAAITRRNLAPKDEVAARLIDLTTDLTELDARARNTLAPLEGVSLIATHPRYQYFARRYGLSISALEWGSGATPSEKDMADLQELSKQTGAVTLIWEAQPPQKGLDLVSALGVGSVVFEPLAHAPGEGDFISYFDDAVTALAETASATDTQN